MLDTIIDPIVELSAELIAAIGLPGVALLMALESACLPVPSEAIMLFAGFAVSKGDLSLTGIVVAGVGGNLVGSWAAYGVGYFGRTEMLERSRFAHVGANQLAAADRWFERWGLAAVLVSRMLPVIRTFISLPAGAARMPFWRFTGLTVAGCIPWVLLLAIIGVQVGDRWEQWRQRLHYLDYPILLALAGLVVWGVVRWRRRPEAPTAP